jgi:hypothetical protein
MARHSTPLPESIVELQAQLDHFRSTHPPRTRLPESLWQSATELARGHGLYLVARSLRLGYMQLKKRMGGESAARRRNRSQPRFIELIGTARERGDEYVVEFESSHGAKMRVHCKTASPPTWAVLLRAWRRAER